MPRFLSATYAIGVTLAAAPLPTDGVMERERQVPLIQDVDVVVVGGGSGAVAAAGAAAEAGARVFLVTAYPCLGEDIAGTLRLWTDAAEAARSPLVRAMFGALPDVSAPAAGGTLYTTPLRVKKALDRALLQAGVPFLTGACTTDVLTDASGRVSGVVIANRSGRQAIRAKVVIDATPRGHLARLAGASVTPFPAGTYTVTRVVIAGDAPTRADAVTAHADWRPDGDWVQLSRQTRIVPGMFECSLTVSLADGSARSAAEAEQVARDRTFVPTQLDAADRVFFIPPDHIRAAAPAAAEGAGPEDLDLRALSPDGVKHLYVLGPMADVPRALAASLSGPGPAVRLGQRLGALAAAEAAARPAVTDAVRRAGLGAGPAADIRDVPGMLTRPYVSASGTVVCETAGLPLLADTDLLVVGGGTTGAPAAVGALRNGVRTLVVEALDELGGVQTAGMICGYYYGNQRGFTKEIDAGVKATGAVRSQAKGEWYRRAIREAGGEIWFGSMGVGAWLEGSRLRGVVVVMPDGTRGLVRARAVIDATGNADVAAAAGEPTEFYDSRELIGQGVGMAVIRLGAGGHNNDFAMVNDSDASDLCFFGLRTRLMTEDAWDVSQLVGSRERRRLVGVFQISVLDYLTGRTFPDTINQHRSRFDLHGQASHDFFQTKNIRTRNHVTLDANAPYRALLPRTTDGLLVVALGMSATRDAMAILRMQPDLQNQGYAAAYAVHLALKEGCELRDIPVRTLQKHLVEKGNLPESVLTEEDSYPLSDTLLKLASHDVMMGYGGLPYLFADPERARPYLREKYRELSTHSSGRDAEVSLVYAHVLAMLGDPVGEDELVGWVETHGWSDPWAEGLSAGGNRMISYILALARAGSKKAVPAIVARGREACAGGKKAPSDRVSRLMALAGQALADPALGELLALMLDCPGVSGHAIRMGPDIPPVPGYDSRSDYSQQEKTETIREINLAAALFRLGDIGGKARAILGAYADDPRGFYAHYARLVLAERDGRLP
ncbi:MAG: FAD-dependent oxidoreductase [Lentisphaeria bacterium]|nr:FAD-dependent oxidoreductase [Lentisphaeria bacterium]